MERRRPGPSPRALAALVNLLLLLASAGPGRAGEAENAEAKGHAAYQQKKFREAASFFELAISLGGNKAENYYWASMGHSAAMEDQEAYEWIMGALSLDDGDPRYHAQHGRVCMFLGNPGEAAMAFEKALAGNPGDAATWAEYGRVLKQSGHPYQSIEALEKAVELDPSRQDVAYELGLAMVELKDPEQAVGAFRKAVTADPRCLECQLSLGDALLATGRPRDALAAYGEVLRLDGDDYRARQRSIQACYGLSDFQGAEPHVRALQKLYERGKVYGLAGREGYLVDEFAAGDLTVQAWEYFEGKAPDGVLWTFDVADPTGFKEAELAVRAGGDRKGPKGKGGLELVRMTDGVAGESLAVWASAPSYPTVRTAVIEALRATGR